MENKLKKLELNQETLRNLTSNKPAGKELFATLHTGCFPCTGTCPTNCACPPPF